MKLNAGPVMPHRVQSINFIINYMRQPGQGVPVSCMKGTESPFYIFNTKPLSQMMVFIDIQTVIQIHKVVCGYSSEDKGDYHS